mgnify:CR=1 FL=1
MGKAPGLIEDGPVAAGSGDAFVYHVETSHSLLPIRGVGNANTPSRTVRLGRQGAGLAHVDQHALESVRAQHVGHSVSNVTLRAAVQGQAHARAGKSDA